MRRRGPGRRDHLSRSSVATGFTLETERLLIRPFRSEDLDALAAIFADATMMQWYPHPFSRSESQRWIERNQGHYEERGYGLWAVELLASGELVGDCGLSPQLVDGVEEIEVGWHVKRELWGQGLAPEAARPVLDYAFEGVKVAHLVSLIRPENVNSWRVAEKLGMRIWKETMRSDMLHRVYRLDPGSLVTEPHISR